MGAPPRRLRSLPRTYMTDSRSVGPVLETAPAPSRGFARSAERCLAVRVSMLLSVPASDAATRSYRTRSSRSLGMRQPGPLAEWFRTALTRQVLRDLGPRQGGVGKTSRFDSLLRDRCFATRPSRCPQPWRFQFALTRQVLRDCHLLEVGLTSTNAGSLHSRRVGACAERESG